MIPDDFSVEPAAWSVDQADLQSVRHAVFVIEQAVPEDEEWDVLDAQSLHVIARDGQRRPIGTGRLTPEGKIGRMAVLSEWRGRGVGEAVLRVLLEAAAQRHLKKVEIHAQSHALGFYEKAGFEAYGEEFDECGIAHRHMRIDIQAVDPRPPQRVTEHQAHALASQDRESLIAAMIEVASGARRELCIMVRELDNELFDRHELLDAIRQLAISGPHVQIRVLVREALRSHSDAIRLVDLGQRLSSVFAFRTPVEEIDRQYPGSFVVNDRGGWFERPLASRFEGEGSTYAPGRAAQLLASFSAIWERSETCAEMRRLDI